MLCPFDATELTVVNRSGIELDWCPSCKGVWLERGELDKLIDQVSGPRPPAPASPEPGYVPPVDAGAPAPAPNPGYAPPPPARRPGSMTGYGQPADYRGPAGGRYSSHSWDDDHGYRGDDRRGDGYRRKRRKSLLSEIFDF